MKYLVLTMASSDPGDSDIVEFSSKKHMDDFIQGMAQGGAHKVLVFEATGGRTDHGGGRVWAPEDEIRGDRLKDIARGERR